MEIYLNLNNKTHKLSLFDDEDLTLTKKWDEQQVMQSYGSFSSTFNIPIDAINSEIFGYYNEIGSKFSDYVIDPNYYISSKIVIDSYEFLGNVQLIGFTEKNGLPYSFQITFYGDEHDLIKEMNGDKTQLIKLNTALVLPNLLFNYEHVTKSWESGNTLDSGWISDNFFIPLMANQRPITLNQFDLGENNIYPVKIIESGIETYQTSSGITMNDLSASYNFKWILDKMFSYCNITHNPSQSILDFLDDMFIMSSTNYDTYTANLLTMSIKYDNEPTTGYYVDNHGNVYNLLKKHKYLENNSDTTSYYSNAYHVPEDNNYKISFNYDVIDNPKLYIPDGFSLPPSSNPQFYQIYFFLIDDNGTVIGKAISANKHDTISIEKYLYEGQTIYLCLQVVYQGYDKNKKKYFHIVDTFDGSEVSGRISISSYAINNYNFVKNIQKWPDMLCSDFFLNFCKSFNIFFIYDDKNKILNTYFKDEIPRTIYDLTDSLIQDKDYAFTHKVLYKKINVKFKEGKDINNIKYKSNNDKKNISFGEYVAYERYDVGITNMTQESIFSVFPNTKLNVTDSQNNIVETTNISFHSELNDSLAPITTDFLLFYRNKIEVPSIPYNLQNDDIFFYKVDNIVSKYGPYQQKYIDTEGQDGYALDYNDTKLNYIDNNTQRYEVSLDFLLELDIVSKLKVYDLIVVNNIYYEIKNITTNVRNGYTTLKLVTINVTTITGQQQEPVIVTTTTTTSAPCNPLAITCTPTYFDHGSASAITFSNLCSFDPSNTPPLTGVSHMFIRNLNISYPAALKYNGTDVYEDQKITFNGTLDDLQYTLIYYANQNNNNTYIDSFDIYFVMECGAFTNVETKEIIINAASIPITTTTTTLPVNTHPPVTLANGSDAYLTLDEENQVLNLSLPNFNTGTTIDKFIDLTDTFNTWPSNHGQMLKVGDDAVEYSTKIGSDATGPWVYVTESHEVTSTNKEVDEMTYTEYYSDSGWTYYRGSFTHITGNTNLLYGPTLPLKYSEDNYDQTEYMLYVIKESTDPISVYLNGALIRLIDGPNTGYNCPFTVPSDGDYVISFEVSSTDAVVLSNLHIDYYYYTDVYSYAGGMRIVDNTYTSQLNYPNHAGEIGDVCVMDDDGLTMTFKSGLDAGLIVKEQLSGLTGGQLLKYYPSTNTFISVPDKSYIWDKAILKDSFSGGTTGFMYQDSFDNYRIVDLSGFTGDYLSKDDFGDGLMKISGDITSTIVDNSDHWNTLDTLGQKKFWQGTAAAYAAITTKDANTLYFINVV